MNSKFEAGVEDVYLAVSSGHPVRDHGPYGILVGDERLEFYPRVVAEPIVSGMQILEVAGAVNRDECLLYQVQPSGVLDAVRPEQSVDLRACSAEKFIVFRSDRSYRFVLNQHSLDWGVSHVSGGTLKKLADVPAITHDVWLNEHERPARLVEDKEFVNLAETGIEHFETRAILISIIVNARKKEIDHRQLTYWEIARLAFPEAQPSDNVIYSIEYAFGPHQNPEGRLVEGQTVFAREGMKFYVSPTDKS